MAHRAGSVSVAITTSLSTALKTAEGRCEGTVPGLRDCKQGTLVTEAFTSGIESEEKSLIIKWHTLYSWQEARDVVVLNNTIAIPGCGQWAGFEPKALMPCDGLDITWSTRDGSVSPFLIVLSPCLAAMEMWAVWQLLGFQWFGNEAVPWAAGEEWPGAARCWVAFCFLPVLRLIQAASSSGCSGLGELWNVLPRYSGWVTLTVALNILQSQKNVVDDKKFVLDGFAKDGTANDAKPKPFRAA